LIMLFMTPPTTETYTLSLHDALPICRVGRRCVDRDARVQPLVPGRPEERDRLAVPARAAGGPRREAGRRRRRVGRTLGHPTRRRSEEHTSELQSPYDLVCRLLLEKKK